MKKATTFLLLCLLILTPNLFAQNKAVDNVWQAANSNIYGTKVGGMLGRGLLNAATCFVDIIVHVVDGAKQGPPVVGSLAGLGSGIGCTALRAISGVLDITTFWVPDFNGFPVSRSYSNCLEFQVDERAPASEIQPAAPEAVQPAAPPPATSRKPEDYAKPAAPAKHHHNAMDYVKK